MTEEHLLSLYQHIAQYKMSRSMLWVQSNKETADARDQAARDLADILIDFFEIYRPRIPRKVAEQGGSDGTNPKKDLEDMVETMWLFEAIYARLDGCRDRAKLDKIKGILYDETFLKEGK